MDLREYPIIGIMGQKGSGKDTLAGLLVQDGYISMAFADALYTEVARRYNVTEPFLRHRPTKETPSPLLGGKSPRQVLQEVGMLCREQDPDYWVRILEERLESEPPFAGLQGILITDVRMPNEVAFIRRAPRNLLVRVVRPGMAETGDTHITEQALRETPCDLLLTNVEGRPESLREQWHAAIEKRSWEEVCAYEEGQRYR